MSQNKPITNAERQPKPRNWAGNLEYSTDLIHHPRTPLEIQQLVRKLDRVKALGTRHCFNDIADSCDNLIALTELDSVVELDKTARTVTVEAGIKYGVLAPYLHEQGFALHNLASLPHITVGGSVATGTHGSGVGNGSLATAVRGLEMVVADGSLVNFTRDKDGEDFLAAVVGLGAVGLITKLTLAIEPAYLMRQKVYLGLPFEQLQHNFDEIMSAGYSVSLFTDWKSQTVTEAWIKNRVDKQGVRDYGDELFGAKAATVNVHPIAGVPAENCTEQMDVAGLWYERLPHFKMGYIPSSGVELQTEYFVAKQHAVEAILAVSRLAAQIAPHLYISEIRSIDADNLWLSPCYHQAAVAIHFTWKQEWEAVSKLLPLIERELQPYLPRPHWGKLFTVPPKDLQNRYEKLEDFKKFAAHYDPAGKFRNRFLNRYIFNT